MLRFAHILITGIETKTIVVSDQLKELQAVKCAVMCLTFFKCSIEEMISDFKIAIGGHFSNIVRGIVVKCKIVITDFVVF